MTLLRQIKSTKKKAKKQKKVGIKRKKLDRAAAKWISFYEFLQRPDLVDYSARHIEKEKRFFYNMKLSVIFTSFSDNVGGA